MMEPSDFQTVANHRREAEADACLELPAVRLGAGKCPRHGEADRADGKGVRRHRRQPAHARLVEPVVAGGEGDHRARPARHRRMADPARAGAGGVVDNAAHAGKHRVAGIVVRICAEKNLVRGDEDDG